MFVLLSCLRNSFRCCSGAAQLTRNAFPSQARCRGAHKTISDPLHFPGSFSAANSHSNSGPSGAFLRPWTRRAYSTANTRGTLEPRARCPQRLRSQCRRRRRPRTGPSTRTRRSTPRSCGAGERRRAFRDDNDEAESEFPLFIPYTFLHSAH